MSIQRTSTKPTYRELLEYLKKIPEEHLDDNITIYDYEEDEFYPAETFLTAKNSDVLDDGHLFIGF